MRSTGSNSLKRFNWSKQGHQGPAFSQKINISCAARVHRCNFPFCPLIPSWLFPKGLPYGVSHEVEFPENANVKPPRGNFRSPFGGLFPCFFAPAKTPRSKSTGQGAIPLSYRYLQLPFLLVLVSSLLSGPFLHHSNASVDCCSALGFQHYLVSTHVTDTHLPFLGEAVDPKTV